MIAEAISKILALAEPNVVEVDGRHYSDRKMIEVNTPSPDRILVCTLTGMIDLINAKVEAIEAEGTELTHSDVVVHVVSFEEVNLIAKVADEFGHRTTFVTSKLVERPGFAFGQWMDHERFLIGVMANFTEQGDREYLLRIASNLTNERVVTSADDGVSQQVGLKTGPVLKAPEIVRNRVKLAPFRTFREVEQPVSEFVFRVSQGDHDETPKLALYEADGGAWKNTAMETVARYLRTALQDITVVS